jgi:hypothetical protein
LAPRNQNTRRAAAGKSDEISRQQAVERWSALERQAALAVADELSRWGGLLSETGRADITRDAVIRACEISPEDLEQAIGHAQRLARSAVRNAKRRAKREQTGHDARIGASAAGALRSGKGSRLRKLGSRAARKLCELLEEHQRRIEQAIDSGGLWRRPQYERSIYRGLFEDIAEHSRLANVNTPAAPAANNFDAHTAALVRWRARHIVARCQQCSPGEDWCECQHTIPRFVGGKQVAGIDLRARGRRKDRLDLQFRFGSKLDMKQPPTNYSATYLRDDAAGRLVTEALRLRGIDSSVRHVLQDERGIELGRQIAAALVDFERVDGELREKEPRPQAWQAPGAFRRAARRKVGKLTPREADAPRVEELDAAQTELEPERVASFEAWRERTEAARRDSDAARQPPNASMGTKGPEDYSDEELQRFEQRLRELDSTGHAPSRPGGWTKT